nr:hypothetical protein [Tanacetum cinerariifolium]
MNLKAMNTRDDMCNLPGSGFTFLLTVATFFIGSGKIFCQWKLYNWHRNFFWQWEHITRSGKTALEVGLDRIFNSQQSSPKLDVASAINYSLTGSYTLTVINASLTENNLHQQCKLFSRGNSLTQQWEYFFTSSDKIALEVGTILHYQW